MVEANNNLHGESDPVLKRISWGAVFAGVIIAFITHVTLSMLGLAVGFSTVDPVSEQDPAAGLVMGEMIWWVISGIIAIGVGAWAASRLSGMRTGILHGVVTWGLIQIILIALLTSAVGTITGGALNVVETGIKAAAKAAPEIAGEVSLPDDADLEFRQQIQKEIETILKQTESPELQPQQLEQEAEQAAETAQQAVAAAAKEPRNANYQIMQAMDDLFGQAEEIASDIDKEAVVNVLVKRTDMTREEAGQTVDNWIETYKTTVEESRQAAKQAGEKVTQTVEDAYQATVETIASAAWWSFIMLVLGAIAAIVGGSLGMRFPKDERHG